MNSRNTDTVIHTDREKNGKVTRKCLFYHIYYLYYLAKTSQRSELQKSFNYENDTICTKKLF